jgi:hypothetical protein
MGTIRKLQRKHARNGIDDQVARIQELRGAVLACCEREQDAGIVQLALLDAVTIVTRMAAQLAGDDSSIEVATVDLIGMLTQLMVDQLAERKR